LSHWIDPTDKIKRENNTMKNTGFEERESKLMTKDDRERD
jgi:hypothetical protein